MSSELLRSPIVSLAIQQGKITVQDTEIRQYVTLVVRITDTKAVFFMMF